LTPPNPPLGEGYKKMLEVSPLGRFRGVKIYFQNSIIYNYFGGLDFARYLIN